MRRRDLMALILPGEVSFRSTRPTLPPPPLDRHATLSPILSWFAMLSSGTRSRAQFAGRQKVAARASMSTKGVASLDLAKIGAKLTKTPRASQLLWRAQ
jgi:hypothetical protein